MTRSSKPYPLSAGEITLTARTFGLFKYVAVEASFVPEYWAQLFYTRLQRMLGPHAGQLPTLEQFRSAGGLSPLSFLDVMAGGTGDGERWAWLEHRRHSLIDFELISSPLYEAPVNVSCAPFPLRGTRVDDGTGCEPGFIPEWMAMLLLRRLHRWNATKSPSVETLLQEGGFLPVVCLDLMIGGRGDGLAHRMVEKKWQDEKALTELERGLLQDAARIEPNHCNPLAKL
jgi:hypothetical protein